MDNARLKESPHAYRENWRLRHGLHLIEQKSDSFSDTNFGPELDLSIVPWVLPYIFMPHVPNDNRPNKKTFYHHLQAYRSQRDTERSRIMSILMDSIQTTSQIGHTGFIEFLEHRRELYSKLRDFLLRVSRT